jgi:hypothetical protein
MAITYNGASTSALYSGVSTSGALTYTFGGTLQSGTAMLVLSVAHDATNTTANPITSITDSQGNTWQKYTSQSANSGWKTSDTNSGTQRWFSVEIWYCINATVNTSINITINHAFNVDAAVATISPKILGYDATNPWDLNGALPASLLAQSGLTAETLTGISTTTAHVAGIWAFGAFSSNIATTNVQFNGVSRSDQAVNQKNNVEFIKGQLAVGVPVTSAYSGVTYAGPLTSADNFFIIGAAITADVQTVGNPVLSQPHIVG